MDAALRALWGIRYTLGAFAFLVLLAVSIWYVPDLAGRSRAVARIAAVERAPTATPAPPNDPLMNPAAPGVWRPVFEDSFNGAALDTSHWNTCFWWSSNAPLGCDGSNQNGELQRYLPQNVMVKDGALDIMAQSDHLTIDTRSYGYTSGLIASDGKFAFRYGYVEARISVTQGKGVWPAFWMLPVDHSSATEIDVAEILCDQPAVLNTALHFPMNGLARSVGGVIHGPDFSRGYHVVGIDWEPQSITWYEDGQIVYRVTDQRQIPQTDMYLILNSAVGGYWSGNPDTTTTFPNEFKVDWIQVWQSRAPGNG